MYLNLQNMREPLDTFNPHFVETESQQNSYSLTSISNENKVFYNTIFQQVPVGIYQATIKGNYLAINPKIAEIYGYSSPQQMLISVNNIKQLYIDSHRHKEVINLLTKTQNTFQLESQVYRQDGSIIWVLEKFSPVKDDRGHIISYIASVEDITNYKKIERKYQDHQAKTIPRKNSEVKFLSMISHEMKSALTIILIASDFLRLHGDKFSFSQNIKYLQKIKHTVHNLTHMIDSFMMLAKSEQGKIKPENINLGEFCQEIWEDVQEIHFSKHQLILSQNPAPIELYADRALLRQIFVNLLGNAVKYSPTANKVEVKITADSEKVTLKISDEGIGISPSDQKKLFSAFHRGENAAEFLGTGLGLAIVKQAVESHGGEISVQSILEQGTTFTLTFPVNKN
jgi:PAS domain S-box-containing protein